jgi:MFS family permease
MVDPGEQHWLRRALPLGLLSLLTLVPVTLPVPVLRGLVLERFDVSQLLASSFMSINMVGAVIAAPIAGALADRFGRRRELILAALVCDAAFFWLMTRPIGFGTFLGLRFLEGCAHIFALSLLLAVASVSVTQQRRGRVMGIVGAGMMLGVALGAPLGGVLGLEDPLVPLRVAAGVVVLAALVGWRLLPDVDVSDERRPGLSEIVHALRGNAVIAAPLIFAFADRFTVGFFTTTFSLYLGTVHAADSARIGLLIAVFMLPFALLSAPFGWLSERYSRVAMLCGGSLVYGIGTLSLGWWSADALPVLMASLGVAAAVMFVPSMIMTIELAPDSIRSTAMGAFNLAGSLGFIIGPMTGGLVSQTVAAHLGWPAGYRAAFGVAGASEILCALLALPLLLRLARSRRTA